MVSSIRCSLITSGTFLLLLLGSLQMANAQTGLIMNEATNGTTGVREYFEMVVVGDGSICNVDLRGWIFDDNNGDFSCGPRSSAGIAPGHARFAASDPTWSAVPLGATIIVYNNFDTDTGMPAPDPTDANGDLVYVVPIFGSAIEITGGSPMLPTGSGSTCPGTGTSTYGGVSYFPNGSWGVLGLRNSGGDAAQTRDASGNYFHGFSYGSTNITGGPDNLNVTTGTGSARTFFFTGGDYRDVSNFSFAAASAQTPGSPNDASNAAFIANLQSLCILPVVFEKNLTAFWKHDLPTLQRNTSSELNFSHFVVERATADHQEFRVIGEVMGDGSGKYEFVDELASNETVWYRLRVVDMDGSFSHSRIATLYQEVSDLPLEVKTFPNPAYDQVNFLVTGPEAIDLQVFNLQGQLIHRAPMNGTTQLSVDQWPAGTYIWKVRTEKEIRTGKFQVR